MTGRTVLVTGASSGIGRETSRLLSELSAKVILVGRNREGLELTASLLIGQGHQIEAFDLTQLEEVSDWLKRVVQRTGPLDGLVHSAGIGAMLPVKAWSSSVHDSVMKINVSACLALAQAFRRPDIHNRPGSIVFVSSLAGLVGAVGISIYSASKGAVVALTKSLALELVRDGIRVNCVAPGAVETELVEESRRVLSQQQMTKLTAMHPLGIGNPRDVANAIAFLLADTSRWITGTTLVVDGGYTAQ